MTFAQRAGDSLNLNPHSTPPSRMACLKEADAEVLFHPLPRPRDENVLWVAARVGRRMRRLLECLGLRQSERPPELLDSFAAATINAGRARFDPDRPRPPLSAWVEGDSGKPDRFQIRAARRPASNRAGRLLASGDNRAPWRKPVLALAKTL